jgi:PAS domain S-box-containing protein
MFLADGGEAGALMRTRDWEASPLGSPDTWPGSLRTVVGLMLTSKFPMFIAWGEELGFLYNDPYAKILGNKHPAALGSRFHDIWADIWPDISPLIDAAMAGEATYRENLPLVMNRKGFPEQTWFTFSYSPVHDESGRVAGMFCACTEVMLVERVAHRTWDAVERARIEKDLRNREATLRENEQRLRATYEHVFAGIGEVDRTGRFLRVNERLCAITGYSREELLGRTFWDLTHLDDREADLGRFSELMLGRTETYTVEKRYIHKDGHEVWVEVAASRVDDAGGQPLYGISVIQDVSERKKAEEHQRLLINELNHRVKNTLATVQSIATQTLRGSETPVETREALESRLFALSRAHNVLTRENWEGALLHDIIGDVIEPYGSGREGRIRCHGGRVHLVPRMALALSMAVHELATNAAKYGSLSNATGEVHLTWMVDHTKSPPLLLLRWEEKDGPAVKPLSRKGFGSRLIERSLAHDLNGEVRIEYAPSGVICSVEAPLPP